MKEKIVRVLIAEGRAHARSAIRLLLAHEPTAVVVGEAADLDAAVAGVAACHPDVVVLDWELRRQLPGQSPGQVGVAALEDLRMASPELCVVALSGLPEARREALAAGADAFVSKGDPPETLLAAIGGCRRRR
jgi:DNA-binding NarL/FixJ family response regulator